MATAPTATKKKNENRKPIKPRSFYMIYKGALEGEPTITFDKEVAMDTLLKANESGDTSLKMKKMTVPKTSRVKEGTASDSAA